MEVSRCLMSSPLVFCELFLRGLTYGSVVALVSMPSQPSPTLHVVWGKFKATWQAWVMLESLPMLGLAAGLGSSSSEDALYNVVVINILFRPLATA
ncbi:hypothetical protein K470DRAFT_257419 [Piedraia hortae CBS 480.64]|uniref:Uncharacterized protein n=1 Tax=Piedraia hortae CBS 480.64 TaxID=1314780 RepID=A0A6A7C0N9_9PEZI|nr:hypothetical protein K470DRAFT_257419 [Piedraia hortae CBS 480.64]